MKKELYFDYDAFANDYRNKISEIRNSNPTMLCKELEALIRQETGLSHHIHRCIMRDDWRSLPHHYSVYRILNFLGTSASKYEKYR